MFKKVLFFLLFSIGFGSTAFPALHIVKSIDDSGIGTLRESINIASAFDTILIDVKGEITLLSPIIMNSLNNLTIIGPYPKHITIKESSPIGNAIFELTSCSNILFKGIGFKDFTDRRTFFLLNSNNIIIEDCLFENNSINGNGNFFINNTSTVIKNTSFIGNTANEGGAIFISSTPNTLFENCTFFGNIATVESGGAVKFTNNSLVNFNHCSFKENFCSSASVNYGHAIHGDNTSPTSNQMNFRNSYIGYNGSPGELQVSSSFTPLGYFSNQGNVIILNGGADNITQYTTNMNFTIINDKILTPLTPDGLRVNLVEDGYGLKYLPIVVQSSPLTDAGKIYAIMPQKDTRRAPRILTGDVNFLPDAGACEYTKYRVVNKLSSGGGSISNAVSSLSGTTDPLKYIEFDFQPTYDPTVPIEITASLNISESVYIDGYSQNNTSISGPDIMGGVGVTPASNLIQITPQSTTDACFVASDTNITITGFNIHGFNSRGIFTNTNGFKCNIYGNHIGFVENTPGNYSVNENRNAGIYVSGKNNQIGGNFHWQRNVISGNGLTGTVGGNYHNIFVINSADSCKIIGNFIGCQPNGISEFIYPSTNNPSGISIKSTACEVGNEKYLGANIIGGNKGDGILIENSSGINHINNNKIGIGYDGETATQNTFSGVKIVNNTHSVKIGSKKGNVISGNTVNGILIISSTLVEIKKNIIGLNESSNAIVSNEEGIRISGVSNNNIIGNDLADGNVISGNLMGIVVENGSNNIIRGNKIGVDITGNLNFGNTNNGIVLTNSINTTVGGNIIQRNIISGNQIGISLVNSGTGTIIKGNYIGLNIDGTSSIPNINGIVCSNDHVATIGGDFSIFENNVISGNSAEGIILNSVSSTISGNTIGLAFDNITPIPNNYGIRVGFDNVSIGNGAFPNIISGNTTHGVFFDNVVNCDLNNCYIGTNTTFDTGIGNGVSGIFIIGGESNQIGNISSVFIGNNVNGIHVENSTLNNIRRCLIGIGSGNQLIPNENGILLDNGANLNSINNALITKNVISGNLENGILIDGIGSNANNISSNFIGTNINGNAPIPNKKGIYIRNNANDNTIGASGDLARRNTISGNTEEGILIQNAESNRVFRNHIGSDESNSSAIPNQIGVKVENCPNENFIGNLASTINKPMISGNHTGVVISNSSNQKIWNCNIGTNSSGISAISNVHGVVLINSDNNFVGGINIHEPNLISGNDSTGISILNSNNNFIKGNKIGTTTTGNAPLSNLIGIYISNSNENVFGENVTLGHNTISANTIAGVIIENNCQDNQFISNFFGTSESGNALFAGGENPIGIFINNVPTQNIIGGTVSNGNVFINSQINIYINNSSNQIIEGNKIGFSFDGTSYLGTATTGDGILLKNSTNIHIGNSTAGRENSIANQNNGIYLIYSDNNFIEKNYIGNSTDGIAILSPGNQNIGVKIDSTSSNNIVRSENIISGNLNQLVILGLNTSNNHIHNNILGLDKTGENILTSSNGITINNMASENIIGGLISERNIISGLITGISVDNNGTDNNIISGNYFGSNASGNISLPNSVSINISQGNGNIIGGSISDSTNYIGGGDAGIQLFSSANNNFIRGNHIGFKPDLSSHPCQFGIEIIDSDGNFIGSVDSDKANRIENNQHGIAIYGFSNLNSMIGNTMKNNTIIGIDINIDGPTINNTTGVQGNIQIPTILQAFQCNGTGNTKVAVEIRNLTPTQQYLIEFFNNTTSPSITGYGEASDFIDRFSHTAIYSTDTIIIDLGVLLPVSNSISATLTSQNGNGNTSEFAQNFSISNQPPAPLFSTQNETCENANDASLTIDNTVNPNSAFYFSYNSIPLVYSDTNSITFLLPVGTYIPKMKYLNGCEVTGISSVLIPGPSISYNISTVDDTCGLNTGEVIINNTSNVSSFPNSFEYAFDALSYTSTSSQTNLSGGTSYIIVLKTNIGLVECFSDTTTLTVNSYNMINGELDFVFNDFCYSSNGLITSMPSYPGGTFDLSPITGSEMINTSTGEISNAVQSQTYTVTYNYGSCSFSQNPTAIDELDASFTFNDHCFGQIEIPSSVISGGTYTFNPIPTDGASINVTTGEISNPIAGTTYQVQYNTGGGCSGTLIQPVLVYAVSIAPEIISSQNLYCGDETVNELLTSISGDANWYLNNLSSGIVEVSLNYTPTLNIGNNTILATYFDVNGCESLPGEIVIIKSDVFLMSAGDDAEICLGAEVQLNAVGGETYEWINITSENDIYNPVVQPLFPTNYIVIITNQDGCTIQDSVLVDFINGNLCDIESFNAFSPNEDGVNDLWFINGIEGYPENKVTIYNRWGDIVISFDNYDNQNIIWNGQNKNTIFVPSGTYYFVIDVNGNQSQSGWVQVLR